MTNSDAPECKITHRVPTPSLNLSLRSSDTHSRSFQLIDPASSNSDSSAKVVQIPLAATILLVPRLTPRLSLEMRIANEISLNGANLLDYAGGETFDLPPRTTST